MAGMLGLGSGGDTSVGRVQMKAPTARRVLETAGYGTHRLDPLRNKLSHDAEFAVFVAALHLKLDLDNGMSSKQAYLSYALDPEAAERLFDPADNMVQNSPVLSARSARYDANIAVLAEMRQGNLWGYIPQVTPRYGVQGGLLYNRKIYV